MKNLKTLLLTLPVLGLLFACSHEVVEIRPEPSRLATVDIISATSTFEGSYQYSYNMHGRVSSIQWLWKGGSLQFGSELRAYDSKGNLSKVTANRNHDLTEEYTFQIQGNRISKLNLKQNGVLVEIKEYSYDPSGKLVKMETFGYDNVNNKPFKIHLMEFSYFTDGNLEKKTFRHDFSQQHPNGFVVFTETFGGYTNLDNPIFDVEFLPENRLQPKLPASYSYESNSSTFQNTYEYQTSTHNIVMERITKRNGIATEQTLYNYR